MTFGDSLVRSGETLMKYRSKESLASGHCMDPVLHRWLVPQTHRLVVGALWVSSVFCFTSARHRRFADSSCDSP
ncbi:hypothetical protein HAX54_031027, partial [Datura stramonium]|nr:hypothetical protein [Datura stramonium]